MLATSLGTSSTLLSVVVVLAIAAVGLTTLFSRRTQNLQDSQDKTIALMNGTISSLEADSALKDAKIKALEEQNTSLMAAMKTLDEKVLQVARVDQLRSEVLEGFSLIDGKLDDVRASLKLLPGGRAS